MICNCSRSGLTLSSWFRLLRDYGQDIDWWPYAPRVVFLGVMATINSLLALPDWMLHRQAVAATRLHPEPVFILGHPRTGTTHVHNLLSLDERFAWADTLAAGFPSSFLTLGPAIRRLAAPLLDSTRPMDAMALSFQTPAEDELAVCSSTGGASPYMPLVFMRDQDLFRRLYTLKDDDFRTENSTTTVDNRSNTILSSQERNQFRTQQQRWLQAFLWFLKKVTLRSGPADGSIGSDTNDAGSPTGTKPLLIKSPVHTARVELLLRLFPRARFIYLHRDPYPVFCSAAHMAQSYYPYTALQRLEPQDVARFVMDQFVLLHETYQADRKLIPEGRLMEVAFEDLDRDPVGTVSQIYSGFGWTGLERLEPRLRQYTASLSGFKKNDHKR